MHIWLFLAYQYWHIAHSHAHILYPPFLLSAESHDLITLSLFSNLIVSIMLWRLFYGFLGLSPSRLHLMLPSMEVSRCWIFRLVVDGMMGAFCRILWRFLLGFMRCLWVCLSCREAYTSWMRKTILCSLLA